MWLVLLLFICLIILLAQRTPVEHFGWDPLWTGRVSLDCYGETPRDCMKYTNCGLCHKEGTTKCIVGDTHGPMADESCEKWQHTNYYDRHIFGEKVETTVAPWSYRVPEYPVYFPSPSARAPLW